MQKGNLMTTFPSPLLAAQSTCRLPGDGPLLLGHLFPLAGQCRAHPSVLGNGQLGKFQCDSLDVVDPVGA